jgi:hypothetical protein
MELLLGERIGLHRAMTGLVVLGQSGKALR